MSVSSLRAKYPSFVREIAEKSLDWKTLGPVVKHYRDLISEDFAHDTRKLFTTDQFLTGTADEASPGNLRSVLYKRPKFIGSCSLTGRCRMRMRRS